MGFLQLLYNSLKSIPIPTFISRLVFGAVQLEPPPETSIQSLPNEVLLEIFSFLELKPYIICHGVCKKWRRLIPLAQMDPTRKRLLELYHRILETPNFQESLTWTDQNIKPFDRTAYILCLLSQYPVIPKEFRMWILEWPARLAIRCIWPGLPFIHCETISPVSQRNGTNWIAYRPSSPQLSALVYKLNTPSQTFIPGLSIWHVDEEDDWLIFDQDEPDLFGRVFRISLDYYPAGTIPYNNPLEDNDSENDEDSDDTDTDSDGTNSEDTDISYDKGYTVDEDWISYLERLWNYTVEDIRFSRDTDFFPDLPVSQPVDHDFDGSEVDSLMAPTWGSRQHSIDT